MRADDLERDYVEQEDRDKAVILSILHAIQDLVLATTREPQHLMRCDEICDAVIAFAFTSRRDPLVRMSVATVPVEDSTPDDELPTGTGHGVENSTAGAGAD